MQKKIFIITGESSGDKIASYIINHIKKKKFNIEFLAIGGENIKSQGINCIFDIKDIAFMGFVDVLKNIFFTISFNFQGFNSFYSKFEWLNRHLLLKIQGNK